MPTHKIALQISGITPTINKNIDVTNDQERNVGEKVLAPGAVNIEEDLVLTNAQVKSLVIQAAGGDITIKTNSTGAPDNTVVMASGDVKFWSSEAGIGVNPFAAADVTKLYLSSTAGATFTLRAIVTSTNG